MNRADWDDMRIFLQVARDGTLTAAGQALGLDPATLGRRVARFEAALGQVLFLRSPQGYVLTGAGERLLDRAAPVEEAMAAAFAPADTDAPGLAGTLRIGAPDGCANFVLPEVCARLGRRHPGLEIQIVALPRVLNLSRREADIAVTVSPPRAGRLLVQKVTDYRLSMAAARADGPVTSVHDRPVVGYIPDMIFDPELDYLAPLGIDRVALASNSVAVQLQLLRQGGALGIVHDFALPFAPELTRVLTDRIGLTRSFYLVRHADARRSDRLARLAEAVAAGMRATVAALEARAA